MAGLEPQVPLLVVPLKSEDLLAAALFDAASSACTASQRAPWPRSSSDISPLRSSCASIQPEADLFVLDGTAAKGLAAGSLATCGDTEGPLP